MDGQLNTPVQDFFEEFGPNSQSRLAVILEKELSRFHTLFRLPCMVCGTFRKRVLAVGTYYVTLASFEVVLKHFSEKINE